MHTLERRLVELNDALLKMTYGQSVDESFLTTARSILAGRTQWIDTGPGDDTVIINNTQGCGAILPTEQPTAEPTEPPTESPCCACHAIVISQDYTTTADDRYVGVNAETAIKITLLDSPKDCTQVIIKSEMSQPVGNKKITIIGSGSALIDSKTQYVIQNAFKSVWLFARDGNWYTIG
jgi:hypothetical protein